MLKVHRCKFMSGWEPKKVTSLSFNKKNTLLAVGRTVRIEIWDSVTHLKRSILLPRKFRVTSVAWLGDRLFSTGLQGYIHEFDLIELKEFRFYDTFGGPGLQMASNEQETRLAVSCQDGSVCIYDIAEKDLVYFGKLSSPTIELPAPCLSWHPSGEQIAVSNLNSLSVFNVAKREQLVHIDLEPETEALCISFLPDYTIAIGTNKGDVLFYDGKLGSPINTFMCHKEMTLAIATSNNGKDVFTSGVDSLICFHSFDVEKNNWTSRGEFRAAPRDIYALAIFGQSIVSAGLDPEIVFSSIAKFQAKSETGPVEDSFSLSGYPQIPSLLVSLAHKKDIVLCNRHFSLELWGLHHGGGFVQNGKPFSYEAPSQHVLSLQISGHNPVVCSSISPCGEYVVYSTCKSTKLYSIIYTNNTENTKEIAKVKSVDLPPIGFSHRVMFSFDSSKLILVSSKSVITIIDLLTHQSERLEKHIDHQNIQPLQGLDISQDGRWLVIGDLTNRIYLYDLKTLSVSKLPKLLSQHTCLKFSPNNLLAITTIQNQAFFWKDGEFTEWTLKNRDKLPKLLRQNQGKRSINMICGISFNPQNEREVFLWTPQNTIVIDFDFSSNLTAPLEKKRKVVERKILPPKPKKTGRTIALLDQAVHGTERKEKRDQISSGIRISSHFSGLMLLDFLESGEMVVLERPPEDIESSLPAPFDRKIFGFS